ncbi:MAG: ABC transporter permease subunit [Sedimentibacter sp.]|uniref:ABC transporter permease n=1 Tax=Sedimentibacter sp. TaxID=1960295 RepID=UPI0029817500|nr:ABC transporter permease subunit [Sedimentibacter sp.]MDW5298616.1 ABC transporter permease subunit [Sedimentibacter sp.]
MRNYLSQNNKNILRKFISAAIFLLAWECAAMHYISIVLPSPAEVLEGFVQLCQEKEFYRDIIITVSRGMIGYILSMALGVIVATVFYMAKPIKEIFYSYIVILQSIPRISWILLAMIWFPFDSTIILFILIITLVPIVTISVFEGYESIDCDLLDMARIFKVSSAKILTYIYLPAISTHIISTSKATLGIMWKTLIMAELLTVPDGLGARMGYLRTALVTDQIIAITVVIVALNCICQRIISLIYKKTQRWKESYELNTIS